MRISVFGLGYVGCVLTACFSEKGHEIFGVDVNATKIRLINHGKSPIIEEGLTELVGKNVKAGRVKAMKSVLNAVLDTDVSFLCVGTPSRANGSIDDSAIFQVAEQIGTVLKRIDRFHIIAIRSTVVPGTAEAVSEVVERVSGRKLGIDFGIASNPEFMREGTAIEDFWKPPYTVIGASDKRTEKTLVSLYRGIKAPMYRVNIRTAEMIKYANNSFHALKVCFANEIGNICKRLDVDSHELMEIFTKDTKLNLSPYYLKPGFAFGGSCLPKDIRAIRHKCKELDLKVPVLNSILESNAHQVKIVDNWIRAHKKKKIGILGLSFKSGTDDLRESPTVTLVESLIRKGYKLKIFDREVSLAKLIGTNRRYIQKEIPHIAALITQSLDDLLRFSEILVVTNRTAEFETVLECLRDDQVILDLVRITDNPRVARGRYEGICW